MNFETAVEIGAARDKVWTTMIDLERWPEWTASTTEVTVLDGRPVGLATRARIKQPRMPTLVWEIVDFQPGVSFTWRSAGPGLETIGIHRTESLADDRTVVTLGVSHGGALAPIVQALTSSRTRRYVLMEAAGLKQRCESS